MWDYPFSPYPWQAIYSSVLNFSNNDVVLICVSLIINKIEHILIFKLIFIFMWTFCSYARSIFLSDLLIFPHWFLSTSDSWRYYSSVECVEMFFLVCHFVFWLRYASFFFAERFNFYTDKYVLSFFGFLNFVYWLGFSKKMQKVLLWFPFL